MKIPDKELKQLIIDGLSDLPVYYPNRTNTQHVIRCQACGDSRTLSHAHLSIHIDVDDDLPMFYRCFKCNDSGIVNRAKLIEWGVVLDADSEASLGIYNKKSKKKYRTKFSDKWEDYFAPEIDPTTLSEMKLAYLNARLGSDFTLTDAQKLKIVTSLEAFYSANYMKGNLDRSMRRNIESRYIGFLSTNNNRIMFRNTSAVIPDTDYRWYNVILNSDNMNPYTFYSIPNSIDMYYTHDINIHIAEGIFDILSIYHNVNGDLTDNNFYYASCGSSALNVLDFLIDRGINTGLNVHIYADKDKSDYFHMKYLLKDTNVYQWCKNIFIHRNRFENEKDYGVPSSRIEDSCRKIYTRDGV